MNYQHRFRAGDWVDVFKHGLLVFLLESFFHKKNPVAVLDLYAGQGLYPYQETLGLDLQACFRKYLPAYWSKCEYFLNQRLYPGSVFSLAINLRSQDRLIATEWVPEIARILKKNTAKHKNEFSGKVWTTQGDAASVLLAALPPKERRGLIVLDPPFEDPKEFKQQLSLLTKALKKFPQGVYAFWYPLKERTPVNKFLRELRTVLAEHRIEKLLNVEIGIDQPNLFKLDACGMVVINPPWQLDQKIKPWLQSLIKTSVYTKGAGAYFKILC
ncbi:MAG: 23S rRNA (adenine(2030)-N(6))-methyltransferase RlmJ [Gammaproteobacteria bacterium]